jgi:hypothetical protein
MALPINPPHIKTLRRQNPLIPLFLFFILFDSALKLLTSSIKNPPVHGGPSRHAAVWTIYPEDSIPVAA